MEKALDYLLRTENCVRNLLQGAASYTDEVKSIQRGITRCGLIPEGKFGEWGIENKNNKNVLFEAHQKYSIEAFTGGLFAGGVLKIAAEAIQSYSENKTIPEEWTAIFEMRFLPRLFFVGRTIHTVPLGLIIHCGLLQNTNTAFRIDELINQEVFRRLGAEGGISEFRAFVDRECDYRNLHSEYFAAHVLDVLGWSNYEMYYADMKQALL